MGREDVVRRPDTLLLNEARLPFFVAIVGDPSLKLMPPSGIGPPGVSTNGSGHVIVSYRFLDGESGFEDAVLCLSHGRRLGLELDSANGISDFRNFLDGYSAALGE